MATLELRVKYETRLSKFLFWTVSLLSPLWFLLPLIVIICSFLWNRGFLAVAKIPASVDLFALGLGAIPLLVIGSFIWLFLKNQMLVLSQQGVVFPGLYLYSLVGRRNRAWYELEKIELKNAMLSDYKNAKLCLRYKGASAELPLYSFKPPELEQLILGIETFADNCDGKDCLLPLKKQLRSELKIEGKKSYTNLWEDELRYRYSSTTFIPLAPGSTLQEGEIKVLRQLGFGGLSAIYLVQVKNKDLAILKESVLPADVESSLKAKAEEQFIREARILAGLEHPQIAKVLDHFVERGHYLLLQYIHGQDLRQYVIEQPAPLQEAEVIFIAIQIAEILAYLHNQETPIVHRDLTPENLIIDDRGKIVLIDFGAANEFLHTATGTLVGKHSYMAPEQLKGKACSASDLYSLGATLHFLLTAKDPVPLSASRPKKLNENISDELDLLVFKLTQAKKSDRHENAESLKTELEALLAKQGSLA